MLYNLRVNKNQILPQAGKQTKMEDKDKNENNAEKIQALREMIYNTEKNLQAAKAMLLQLEGKKKVGRKRKASETDEGKIIEGTFDGQIMIGTDGKQYPVPANYASKSKLVEGDMLKLTITPDGSFIYKQIGPAERKRLIGIVNQDASGNYFITAEGRPYRVLLASITYYKVEPGDEVTLVIPRDIESEWGAIENVIQKGGKMTAFDKEDNDSEESRLPAQNQNAYQQQNTGDTGNRSIIDEWLPDMEELKKELNNPSE